MAQTRMQRRSSFTWLWIILGIVVVIAVIWWAGDTGPTIPQDTTGAGTVDTAQYGASQPSAVEQTGNPGAAGAAAPAASPSANPPAMSDETKQTR